MKPLEISERDLGIIKDLLLSAPEPANCLEWGAGGSTVLFPKWLKEAGKYFSYTSIEHDSEWHSKVLKALLESGLPEPLVSVYLVRCEGDPTKQPQNEYVGLPLRLRQRWQFIFVDGRHRRRCLINASKLLAVDGVCVLHDAKREHYWCAFEHFARGEFMGDNLWVGRIDV